MWKPMGPRDLFLRLQVPFAAGTLFVVVAAGLAVPGLWSSSLLLAGAGAAVAASLSFLPSRRGWLLTRWGIVVPLVDIVSVALVRAELFTYIPTVGVLCLMPFAWIALRYRWQALSLVFLGGILISALPLVLARLRETRAVAVLDRETFTHEDTAYRLLREHRFEKVNDRDRLADAIAKGTGERDPTRTAALERCERVLGRALGHFWFYAHGVAERYWQTLAERCRTGTGGPD